MSFENTDYNGRPWDEWVRFKDTINYGNWVVDSFIAPGATFQEYDGQHYAYDEIGESYEKGPEWTQIGFYNYDPIANTATIGEYGFKEDGLINYYAYSVNPVTTGGAEKRTSVYVELFGNFEDFMNHAYSFDQFLLTPYSTDLFAQSLTSGNGQEMANVIDSLPGANPYNLESSAFQPGGYGYAEWYSA